MSQSSLLNKPQYNETQYNYGAVNTVEGKYHLKIAGIGFVLTHDPYSGRHNFGRDQAPSFVSKQSAGDPTYRDSSFFPHWVQMNWRNGAKQDEWDDEARFLKSKNVDITAETKLTLSKLLSDLALSAGTGVDVTCFAIDFSDSRKVFAGCSNGHIWRFDGASWSDMGDVTAVGGGQAGRRINCLIFSKIGLNGARAAGAGQIYAGVGTPAGTGGTNAAQIYRYDGTWASAATFASRDALTMLCEFNGVMYAALGGVGEIQQCSAANLASAWTVAKDIDYPGYIWAMVVYNQRLYVGGGHPENSPTTYQLGTLWTFDGYLWAEVQPFNSSVIRSLCVYDNLLFIGTMHGQLYVYNRANIDLLYEMPADNTIYDMIVFDDKLYLAVSYRGVDNDENAVYLFDRAGTHKAHSDTIKPMSLLVYGDNLFIGGKGAGIANKIEKDKYFATGELQSSYFNAVLPNIDKVWFDVSIEMDSLPASQKIEFYYKTDESDAAWIKVDETTEAGKKLAIFSFPEGTYSKKLSYKIILTTTDNTKTATIRKVIIRYIVQPDFKYLWRFKVACPDNVVWLDDTEPSATLEANSIVGDTQILVSDSSGFPDPGGERMYAVIEDKETGEKNEITYTGKSGNYLTGCSSIQDHDITSSDFQVSIMGRHFHKKLLELKQRKAIVEFVDIDQTVYRVLMHDYSEDGFVMNQIAGLENEVAVSLLQA